jgi:hypothetical protein
MRWCWFWLIDWITLIEHYFSYIDEQRAVMVVIVSYGSWIDNYPCSQWLSQITLWVRIPFMEVYSDNFELCSAWGYIIVRVMVFNVTFNNMLAISWQSVLLVEQTGENHRPVTRHSHSLLLTRFVTRVTQSVAGTAYPSVAPNKSSSPFYMLVPVVQSFVF